MTTLMRMGALIPCRFPAPTRWHGQPQQVARDRRRLNELTAAGWTVVFVTAADLREPVALIARIAAALEARRYA